MIRRPPRSTRTDTLFPYTTLFRSADLRELLDVPPDYAVMFMQGGGLGENAIVPMNLIGRRGNPAADFVLTGHWRSEEHTSELQSLMRISYAVFCLKKKTTTIRIHNIILTSMHIHTHNLRPHY